MISVFFRLKNVTLNVGQITWYGIYVIHQDLKKLTVNNSFPTPEYGKMGFEKMCGELASEERCGEL